MRRLHHLVFAALAGLLPLAAGAQTFLLWDVNGATAGIGTGGGTWSTTAQNWTSSATGNIATDVWLNDGTARADFSPTSGSFIVTLDTGVKARGVRFSFSNAPGSTITLDGGTPLILTDPLVQIAFTGDSIWQVSIVSPGGLSFDGANGSLTLNMASPGLSGVTTVTNGTLVFNHPDALGPGTPGNGIVVGDGRLQFNYVSGGDFSYTIDDAITFNGNGRIGIEFEQYGNRSATLTGAITLTTNARFEGGSIYDDGTARISSTGVIAGASRNVLIKGDVGLAGTNTFTGKVQIATEHYGDDGKVTVPVFNNDGAAGPLGAGAGLELGTNDGESGSWAEVHYTGATASSNRSIQIMGEGGSIAVTDSAATLTLTGVISGSGWASGHSLEKLGPGTLALTGNNTYQGDTYLANGTLVVGHDNALGTNSDAYVEIGGYYTDSEDNLALYLKPGVTLNRYIEVYDDNDYGTTTIGLLGAGTASFGDEIYLRRHVDIDVGAGGILHFNDLVEDGVTNGSLAKLGTGLANFAGGVDIRGGGVDVAAGEVRLGDEVYVEQDITVSSGATLSGTASITTGGYLLVQSGGTLSPGESPGTMEAGRVYLAAGSDLHWELGGLSTVDVEQFDRLVITGDGGDSEIYDTATLTIDLSLLAISLRPGNADPLLNDLFWRHEKTWTIVGFLDPDLGREDNLAPGELNPMTVVNGAWAGGTFTTLMGGSGDMLLRFTPVPEPSTWALFGLGGALAVLARRRRR